MCDHKTGERQAPIHTTLAWIARKPIKPTMEAARLCALRHTAGLKQPRNRTCQRASTCRNNQRPKTVGTSRRQNCKHRQASSTLQKCLQAAPKLCRGPCGGASTACSSIPQLSAVANRQTCVQQTPTGQANSPHAAAAAPAVKICAAALGHSALSAQVPDVWGLTQQVWQHRALATAHTGEGGLTQQRSTPTRHGRVDRRSSGGGL